MIQFIFLCIFYCVRAFANSVHLMYNILIQRKSCRKILYSVDKDLDFSNFLSETKVPLNVNNTDTWFWTLLLFLNRNI